MLQPAPACRPPRSGPRRVLFVLAALTTLLPLLVLAHATGHLGTSASGHLELVWGQHGRANGQLQRPRALAIDRDDRLYIVDKTARIQVFDRDGRYLRGWRTPEFAHGKPTGLSFDGEGNLLVADTHYFRILVYRPDGELLSERTLGGTFGNTPGTFGLVTDAVTDSQGCLYVSEYGEYDRIQKFSPSGEFLMQWGGHGSEPGQFIRPQSLAVDEQDRIWVADACNDRIQVFDARGTSAQLVQIWGERGSGLGQLRYPYNLILDPEGPVYVCEFGNHRIQKLTRDGQPLAAWGVQGRGPGELSNPWGLVQDSRGRLHVLDTYNHRVQRIRL